MARFVRGDIVVVPFPFSDLTSTKRRPAFVLAEVEGNNVVLCQITSRTIKNNCSLTIEEHDFKEGSLRQTSNVRPDRIFTADNDIVLYRGGILKTEKVEAAIERVIQILTK